MPASRSKRVAGGVTQDFGGARRASEDRRRQNLHAGTRAARSGHRRAGQIEAKRWPRANRI